MAEQPEQPPQVPVTVNFQPNEIIEMVNMCRAFAAQQPTSTGVRSVANLMERFEAAFEAWQKQNSPVQIVTEETGVHAGSDNHIPEAEQAPVG